MSTKLTALLLGLAAITCTHGPGATGDPVQMVDSGEATSERTETRSAPTEATQIDPGSSLYALDPKLTDHRGDPRSLTGFQGSPLIISMFYGTCPYACPMLIGRIGHLLRSLEPTAQARTHVLLVSLDPERDTHQKLNELKQAHGLDERWVLASAPADDVRELAAVLGIKYRRLEGGGFNHSTVLTVLDHRGRARGRLDGLEHPLEEMTRVLNALAGDPDSPGSAEPGSARQLL
jgi:protein SCO1